MMPRPGVLQGAEAGLAFALLYGIGTGAAAPWQWLQLPVADDRYHKTFRWTSSLLCLAFVGYGLAREIDWQNATRRAMDMPAVDLSLPIIVAVASAAVALFLIGVARLFKASAMLISVAWQSSSLAVSRFSLVLASRRPFSGASATVSC